MPVGGTTGQVLAKDSNVNYDFEWIDITGTVVSVNGETGIVTLDKSDIGLGNVTNDAQLKVSDLDTDTTLAANSDAKVASQKATKAYVDTQVVSATIPDATSLVKGKIQLAGDLSGTAASPTVVATNLTSPLPISQGGTGAITDIGARVGLGLDIGSDVQAYDVDLDTIASLSPLNDSIIQRKSGAWTHRTPSQLKTDLDLTSADVGLGDVPNINATLRSNHTGTQLASTVSDFSEAVDDRVNLLLQEGTGINLTYDDNADTLTIDATGATYTDEQAQDAIGSILTDSNTVDQTYDDVGNTISADVRTQMSLTSDASGVRLAGDTTNPGNNKYYGTDGSGTRGYFVIPASSVLSVNSQTGAVVLDTDDVAEGVTNLYYTDERASDLVGTMVTGNTETGITVTYQDGDNTLDFAVTDSPLLNGQSATFYQSRTNHTGTQLAATISDFDTQVRTNRLDQMATPTANVSLDSHKLVSVTDPTSDQDAATKAYVDSVAQGLIVKDSVHVATTGNITLSGEQTIDGVLTSSSRVLVKDQTTASENGIYISSAGAWSRSTDADAGSELTAGTFTFVSAGTANASSGWVQTTTGTITLGTTSLIFSQFSGAGQIIAGAALVKTGNTIDVIAGTGITVSGDNVAVDSTVYRQGSTDVAVADGGTGASSASSARTNLGVAIGTDVQAYDATLSALATYNTNGLITQTNSDTFTGRAITAASSKITITNGDGVAGNPTIDVAEGSISRNNLGGGALTIANGGTGQTTASAAFSVLSPLTTLGDILYRDGSASVPLLGNITTTKNFLAQTGTGSVSAAPVWSTISASDVPNIENLNTSGGLTVLKGGTGATTASGARANLGVAIGSDVQAYDAELAAISGLTSAANKLPYFTGSGTASLTDLTSFGRTFLDDADAVNARNTIGAQSRLLIVVGPTGDLGYVTDGTADNVQIQAAIDAVGAAGGGIVELQEATYNLTTQININYDYVTLRGTKRDKCKLLDAHATGLGFLIRSSHATTTSQRYGLTIENLWLDGNTKSDVGLTTHNAYGFIIRNCKIGNMRIDGNWALNITSIDPNRTTSPSTAALANFGLVENCELYSAGTEQDLVAAGHCRNITFRKCTIRDPYFGAAGMLSISDGTRENIVVDDCVFYQTSPVVGVAGIYTSVTGTSTKIVNCDIRNLDTGAAAVVMGGFNTLIEGNYFGHVLTSRSDTIPTHAKIIGNTIDSSGSGSAGISLQGDYHVVHGNIVIPDNAGIYLNPSCDNCSIDSNIVINANASAATQNSGIEVRGTNNTISGNTIIDDRGTPFMYRGIYLSSATECKVIGNTISGATVKAIESAGTTANTTVGLNRVISGASTITIVGTQSSVQTPTTFSGLVDFTGTTHAGLKLNSLTTTQRDALTPANGMLIYNTTNTRFEKYEAGAWGSITGAAGAPVGAQYVTLATDSGLTSERVLTGTANQVVITDGGSGAAVTLSLPQSIHSGATPTFSGLNLSSPLTAANGGTGQTSLTNLPLTTPRVTSGVKDANGNMVVSFSPVVSAINSINFQNNAAGGSVVLSPVSSGGTPDTNVGLIIKSLGTGGIIVAPATNSTTAVQVSSADGSVKILNADTTNGRLGVNTTAPTSELDVAGKITTTTLKMTTSPTTGYVLTATDSSGNMSWQPRVPSVVTLTDAATIATDASLGNHFRVTLGGNRTLGAPTNPVDGQTGVWEFVQDATGGRTISLNAVFSFGNDLSAMPSLSTAPATTDYMLAKYKSSTAKWHVLSVMRGY